MEKLIDKLYELLTLDKPIAATAQEWEQWTAQSKANKPIAWFLNETVPNYFNKVCKVVRSPFNNLVWWFRYRIFDRYHVIKTGLKPDYYDTDTRMLYGMFNLLVDYVEIEKAWMMVVFDDDRRYQYNVPWWSLNPTRFKSFRNAQAGLDHLAWETTLDDPNLPEHERSKSQAHHAREVLFLYNWWKTVRPNRPDPHDASGWTALCDQKREQQDKIWFLHDSTDSEEQEKMRKILDDCHRIEQEYLQEDEQMLIRLVKIRTGLWT